MEFSEFELSLLLILVEGRIDDLKISLLDLDFYKNSFNSFDYLKKRSEINNALECSRDLRNKIEKILEE